MRSNGVAEEYDRVDERRVGPYQRSDRVVDRWREVRVRGHGALEMSSNRDSGQGGIRTLETLLTFTRFPGVRLQPLGHLSRCEAAT